MRQDRWRAILAARDDIDKLVAAAVGDYPSQPPPRATTSTTSTTSRPAPRVATAAGVAARSASTPQTVAPQQTTRMWREPARMSTSTGTATAVAAAPVASIEHEVLLKLHQDVLARIEVLRSALASEAGVEQAMLALVLYFDERIMSEMPEYLATSWPLLQTRLTGRKTGGSDFFRLIDRLLESEQTQQFVLEVYYFCLAAGFQGQYADDLASLEAYKQRLRPRIQAPEPEKPAREQTASPSASSPLRSPALYYVIAGLVVILVAVLLTVWSNR